MYVVVPESWTGSLVSIMMSKEGTTTMNQRRSFTPQFKTQVVLEILTRLKSTAQVCREYDLKEQVVLRWKLTFSSVLRPSSPQSRTARRSKPALLPWRGWSAA